MRTSTQQIQTSNAQPADVKSRGSVSSRDIDPPATPNVAGYAATCWGLGANLRAPNSIPYDCVVEWGDITHSSVLPSKVSIAACVAHARRAEINITPIPKENLRSWHLPATHRYDYNDWYPHSMGLHGPSSVIIYYVNVDPGSIFHDYYLTRVSSARATIMALYSAAGLVWNLLIV